MQHLITLLNNRMLGLERLDPKPCCARDVEGLNPRGHFRDLGWSRPTTHAPIFYPFFAGT